MVMYMKVTNDKYELPVAVAESIRELADMLHVSYNSVASALCHGRKTFKKVVIDDEE